MTVVPPFAWPVSRPLWTLRCLTFLGINVALRVLREVGRFVVVAAGPAFDVLLLGEEAFQLRVHDDDRPVVVGGRLHGLRGGRGRTRFAQIRPPATAAGGDDPTGAGLAGRLPHRHRRLPADLVLRGGSVREDVTFVDPHLHADPTVCGAASGNPEAMSARKGGRGPRALPEDPPP